MPVPREAYLPCFEYYTAGMPDPLDPARRLAPPPRRCHWRWLLSAAFQMIKDLLDNLRIFDAGNYIHRPAAMTARFDIDLEHPLQQLKSRSWQLAQLMQPCPRPRPCTGRVDPVLPARAGGCSVQYPMKARKVHARFQYQCLQPAKKMSWHENAESGIFGINPTVALAS